MSSTFALPVPAVQSESICNTHTDTHSHTLTRRLLYPPTYTRARVNNNNNNNNNNCKKKNASTTASETHSLLLLHVVHCLVTVNLNKLL